MSIRSTLAAAAVLFVSANAHIIMESPVPYSVDKIDNGPITAAQFPCKAQNGFTVSKMNDMAVGQKQTIKFKGTAVHGGGSCQLSVTMDKTPTKDSVFKVIKSIEGGCPGTDGKTNEYEFELPDSIPNGDATFSWSWLSKMSGAPELYHNCAPIRVTGGASDMTAFNALPDMLRANLGDGCTSAQNFATKYPNPGSVVEQGAATDQKPPTGSCGASSGGSTPAEPSSPAGQAPSSPTGDYPAQSSAATPPSAPSAPLSNPGGAYEPAASGAPAVAPTTLATVTGTPAAAKPTVPVAPGMSYPAAPGTGSPAKPTAPAAPGTGAAAPAKPSLPAASGTGAPAAPGTGYPAAPSSPSAPSPSAPSPPTTGGVSGTSCSTPGAIVCNGEKQFGVCNNGSVVFQDVSAGTTCANGVVSKRSFNSRIARSRYMRAKVAAN